jgi:hypothetical protein
LNKLLNFNLLVVFILLGSSYVLGQKTIVTGKVSDSETGEPLPFVNLVFKGGKIGTSTDFQGNYRIETYYPSDSLVCSFVGYLPQTRKVERDESQVIDFKMIAGTVALQQVEIVGSVKDENPALTLLEKVIQFKEVNNREKLDAYEYETYNKIEFDLNNVKENLGNNKLMKPFKFIFDNIDTTEDKPYLPFFMTETLSEYCYRKDPKTGKEIIKGTKVSGLENESVSQFLGDMYQNINIYDNYLHFFGKGFVSPIANFASLSYQYYIVDSAYIDNVWCYKLNFFPKRQNELTFEGNLWISDTTYAVKRIDAEITEGANINFINRFSVHQEYSQVEKEVWMLTKDVLVVDFELTKKALGFYGRKTSTYRNFKINKPRDEHFYDLGEDVIVLDSAESQDAVFWENSRHQKLTGTEKAIYHMVDTLKEIPRFRTYIDLITILVSGYYVTGPVEIGPYYTFYSFNPIEGNRIRFGGRTSNDFSTRIMPEAYVAYGFKDDKVKYGGGLHYFITKKPRQLVKAFYRNDIEQLGQGLNAWKNDNILASLFRRNPANKLNGYEEYKLEFEREWFQGFSNEFSYMRRTLWSVGDFLRFERFNNLGDKVELDKVTFSEFSVLTRFAYKEKFVSGEFERMSLGTKYPTLMLKYSMGLSNFLGGDYDYHRLVLNVKDKIWFSPLGYSNAIFELGKVFGNAPFPVLELHNGNETFAYDPTAFNLMNFYEFVSNEYASISITHHFNGILFNRIPLFSKLKFREVATFKAVAGRMRGIDQDLLNFPEGLSTLGKPYYESGIGVENIGKVLRVDAIWRLSHLVKANISKFGIRAIFQIRF